MYPDKKDTEERLKVVTLELELLYEQSRLLSKQIKKLESEKTILHRLIGIHNMEAEDGQ